MPGTLLKFRALQRKKKSFCAGRATKADVKRAATLYVTAAVAKGQTKAEAQKKANRVMNLGCSISANIAGKRKTTRARKPAARKTRTRSSARA